MKLEDLAKLVNGRDYGYGVRKPVVYKGFVIYPHEVRVLRELEELCGEFSFEVKTGYVTQLDLSRKGLTELPESIGELKNLRELNLEFNKITRLPESIRKLKNLTKLYLKQTSRFDVGNGLHLPDTLFELVNLQEITVSWYSYIWYPKIISQLRQKGVRIDGAELPKSFMRYK